MEGQLPIKFDCNCGVLSIISPVGLGWDSQKKEYVQIFNGAICIWLNQEKNPGLHLVATSGELSTSPLWVISITFLETVSLHGR